MPIFDLPTLTGFLAALLVLATFSVKTMLPLRLLGIASNLAFIIYGLMTGALPIWLLHAILLPLNLWRLFEIQNISRRIRRTRHYGYELEPILPLMNWEKFSAGETLFAKDDPADRLYVLVSGEVLIPEAGISIEPGTLFGEFGLFTKSGLRTSSAVCQSDVEARSMSREEVDRLYFQNPEFGLALMTIITTRMAGNIERLENEVARRGD